MVTRVDSPDGKTHKDLERPSPDLVKTYTASEEVLPDSGSRQTSPPQDKPAAASSGQHPWALPVRLRN
jgi:hypothetical protein